MDKNTEPTKEIEHKLVKEFFGLLPEWKVNTQKVKDRIRDGWKV